MFHDFCQSVTLVFCQRTHVSNDHNPRGSCCSRARISYDEPCMGAIFYQKIFASALIDNTLVDHAGKLIEDVGWFWDHANERHTIAHDYLISNYVCPSGAHYPIEWRRFRKKEACPKDEFKDHTELCMELIDDVIARGIPGDFTF